ncbi:hypothetical protein E4T56_gene5222 [Termitomyces sp. T112]|nr:hypothetical protein E4T56_gene5222 [Termitomyces sp. T112]
MELTVVRCDLGVGHGDILMGLVGKQIVPGSGEASGVQGNSGDASTAAEKALELVKELLEFAKEVSELPKVGAGGGQGVSGRGSGVEGGVGVGQPPMKVGPPWSGWREGAPTMRDKGKWRVSPLPEVGPSKQAWGEPAMAGPLGPMVYSLTSGALVEQSVGGLWLVAEAFLQCRAEELERLLATYGEEVCRVGEERDGLQRELDRAWKEQDLVCRDKDITVGTATEQLLQLQELQVWMWGTQWGSSAEVTQATAERAQQWKGWLANEVASEKQGVLHWAREHCILLDGASVVLGSIHDRLARMPGDLPPELEQGVTQMGHLLVGHWRRAMADPEAWWEVAIDVVEPLLGHPKVLAMVVAQLEVDLMGRIVEVDLEGEGD